MFNKFYLKLSVTFFFTITFVIVFITKASASEYIIDDFNNSILNQDTWYAYNELNTPLVSNGYLNISNVDFNRAHFVYNKAIIPDNSNLEFNFKFKFNSFSFGSGIAITDHIPTIRSVNVHPGLNDWIIFIWPTTSNTFKVFSIPCIENTPCLPQDNVAYTISGSPAFDWHTMKIIFSSGKYSLKLDDQPVINTTATTRLPKYVWFGNPMITQGTVFSSFVVDSVYITDFSLPPAFPYFSQLDPRWKDQEYDTASTWAGLDKYGIGRWGCALSSTAMVLQKNGVKTLDGTEIDPSKLNNWLKTQPDGYVGKGYLNWLAITRYVAESNRLGYSPTKFEFSRTGTMSYPSILGLPGHYVVVHGEDGDNWLVNDPASKTITKIPKTTAYKSINTFTPSMTDLSYLMFVTDQKVNVKAKNESDKSLYVDWNEEYLQDKTVEVVGPTTKTGMIAKPKSGEYELRVENPSNETMPFEIYAYDIYGNPWIKKIMIPKRAKAKYELKYNRDKLSKIKLENERRSIFDWFKKDKED